MRITTFLNNGVEWHVMFRAALELNCIFVPLNPMIAFNERELGHALDMIKPSVLLVEDAKIAEKLQLHAPETLSKTGQKKLFSTGGKDNSTIPKDWHDFVSFAETVVTCGDTALKSLNITRKPDDVIAIFMTSGTTNLPKGCPYTNYMCTSMMNSYIQHMDRKRDPARVGLCHMPTSHITAVAGYAIGFPLAGLTVVHAGPVFDARSSLKAIELERCSDIPCVPATLNAMLADPNFHQVDTSCIKHIILGATSILPKIISSAQEDMKAERASEAYGMTETGPCLMHAYSDIAPSVPKIVTCGLAMPGVKVRIRDPATNETVMRGAPGELHIGGDFVIKEYWLGETQRSRENLYTDEHGLWIMTGDQGVMHENGECQIVGRYKDIIIRGGENISPHAIESIIHSKFNLASEVVGVPDEITGEIAIAVIQKELGREIDATKVKETLVEELGAAWAPEEIIDLDTLGISDYPRTFTGKVLKAQLRKIVIEYLDNHRNIITKVDILATLTTIWSKVLGISAETLTPQSSTLEWGDSLVQARFSAVLLREAGLFIRLHELLEHPTIEDQTRLLSARSTSANPTGSGMLSERDGPPGIYDMVHSHGDEERLKKTQSLSINMLKPLGLGWDDIEDVVPMNGTQELFLKYRRPQSQNHRHAFLCNRSTVAEVRKAIQTVLVQHSMLRTMALYFDSCTSLHVIVRPSDQWFSKCIQELPPIAKEDDLSSLAYGDIEQDHACFPGPLLRFIIAHVEETKCAGVIYMVQHSVFDSVSLSLFLDDLDTVLTNPATKLKPHFPYKAWADSYYNLQYSSIAKASVEWHVSRLRGISKNPAALFPTQRAPEWFKGSSHGWIDIKTGRPGPLREPLTPNYLGVKGITGQVTLPDLRVLKMKYNIEAPQLAKAALAIVTIRRTKQPYALFGQVQAGRTWPFMLEWQANNMSPAMDVAGPTFQVMLDKVPVNENERVIDMLLYLQTEQYLLSRHSCAPLRQVASALNENETPKDILDFEGKIKGSPWIETEGGEGDFMCDAIRRNYFNWLPTRPEFNHKTLQKVQMESRVDSGCVWQCYMLNHTTVMVHPTWDDAQMKLEEVEEMLEEILKVSEKFAMKENWTRMVEEFV